MLCISLEECIHQLSVTCRHLLVVFAQSFRDPESSNILDYCDDAVIVVPGLPEKEADVLCNSFILKEQVIYECLTYVWKQISIVARYCMYV